MPRVRLSAAWLGFCAVMAIAPLEAAQRWDAHFSAWLRQAVAIPAGPAWTLVRLGDAQVVIPAVAVIAGLLLLQNRRAGLTALWLAGALVLASAAAVTLKHLIVHPGPPGSPVTVPLFLGLHVREPYSFPSGHALRTTMLAASALRRVPWLGGAVVVSMMTALIYLQGHWLSDVVGGLCLGWTIVEAGALVRTARRSPSAAPTA